MQPLVNTTIFQACAGLLAAILLLWWLLRILHLLRAQRLYQKSQVDRINSILPQTQCGECGFAGCRPYARAISKGEEINKCPPGGDRAIKQLATLLNEQTVPLNPAHGSPRPARVAVIREAECIGCTKCIQACPVDAILGGPKLMHTVIEAECSGCDLCVEPCPVDCIDMVKLVASDWRWQLPANNRTASLPPESNP